MVAKLPALHFTSVVKGSRKNTRRSIGLPVNREGNLCKTLLLNGSEMLFFRNYLPTGSSARSARRTSTQFSRLIFGNFQIIGSLQV
jgi:hypothetical protein